MNGLYPDSSGLSLPLETHHGSDTTPVLYGDLSEVCDTECPIDLTRLATCTKFSIHAVTYSTHGASASMLRRESAIVVRNMSSCS